ncbi:hypothetical protein FQA18_08550, partial [Haloferax volcanii]
EADDIRDKADEMHELFVEGRARPGGDRHRTRRPGAAARPQPLPHGPASPLCGPPRRVRRRDDR